MALRAMAPSHCRTPSGFIQYSLNDLRSFWSPLGHFSRNLFVTSQAGLCQPSMARNITLSLCPAQLNPGHFSS
jgi:hypothetical protein